MSVSCGSREFISSLVSSRGIERCEVSWRACSGRTVCASQTALSRRWLAGDGNLRFRCHGLRGSQILVSPSSQSQRRIVCARPSDSDSLTEDAENGSLEKPETAGDSADSREAAFRRDAGPSTSSEAVFDGCIAEFLPASEQKVCFSSLNCVECLLCCSSSFRFGRSEIGSPRLSHSQWHTRRF